MSYLESLPYELLVQEAQYLPVEQVHELCARGGVWAPLCNDAVFWGKKVEQDLKFPRTLFLNKYWFPARTWESLPLRYFYIREDVPSEESLQLLNEMAPHWNFLEGWWPDEEEVRARFDSEEDLQFYLEHLALSLETSFSSASRIHLVYRFEYTDDPKKYEQRSLVREVGAEPLRGVTFRDVLQRSRDFARDDYRGPISYTYEGFFEDGFPQLSVEIDNFFT